ncbi:MAG: type transporter [Solirubrobacterales bacterium]|nr:type transporter [Solirubrobacterales bacterium]
MGPLRFLLVKDLQILRRSPLLLVLLALYAIVIGLPVGYAVSRPPTKPKVAFFNEVPASGNSFSLGGKTLDASKYADRLFDAIDPIRVDSRQAALGKVKDGEAVAALIVPKGVTQALQAAVSLSGSSEKPTLEVYYAADNPLKRNYVEDTINAQVAKANQALGRELTKVAAQYIGVLLKGGGFSLLGQRFDVLGLQRSTAILAEVERTLPARGAKRAEVERVRRFAQLAVDNLDLSDAVLSTISNPIAVDVNTVDGQTSSLDGYAVAAAVTIALMFVGLLVAAGMLALEREEHAFGRLVRGLVGRTALVAEKILLGAIVAAVIAVLLVLLLALFQPVDFGRAPEWLPALVVGALGFGAMGVAIGALTRDVRASSLLAFLLSLPVAALALVPSGSISKTAYDAVQAVGALFPFKPTLQALDAGLNGAGPALGTSLLHLTILIVGYGLLARLGLRRFGART